MQVFILLCAEFHWTGEQEYRRGCVGFVGNVEDLQVAYAVGVGVGVLYGGEGVGGDVPCV